MRRATTYALQTSLFALTLMLLIAGAIHTPAGQRNDQAAMTTITEIAPDSLTSAVNLVMSGTPEATVSVVLLSMLGALKHRRAGTSLIIGSTFVVSAGTSYLLKTVVIHRPNLLPELAWYTNSLPPGHATLAIAAACAIAAAMPRRMRGIGVAIAATLTLIVTVGVTVSAWHRPSDVLAAALIVGGCGSLSKALAELEHLVRRRDRPARTLPAGGTGCCMGASAAGVCLAFACVATQPSPVLAVLLSSAAVVFTVASAVSTDEQDTIASSAGGLIVKPHPRRNRFIQRTLRYERPQILIAVIPPALQTRRIFNRHAGSR